MARKRLKRVTGDSNPRMKGPFPPGAKERIVQIRSARRAITGPQGKLAKQTLMNHTFDSKRRLTSERPTP